jgi:DNA-nicking Smr family endonuclease
VREKEKKDPGNPFAGLDSSLFPPAKEGTLSLRSARTVTGPPADKAGASASLARGPSLLPFAEAAEAGGADQEKLDFFQAMAGVSPLAGRGREVPSEPEAAPAPRSAPGNPLQDIVDGKLAFALSGSDEYAEGHVVGLDMLTVGKLQARQYSPESHIDLHGLNSWQAFQNMVHFFRAAYIKGERTVLVVTGRGRNSPNGVPVLRFKVQEWLTQEPLRRVVLAFCTAKQEDGGLGALYVLLRKHRKNSGKIRWDAIPADPDFLP